MDEETLAKVQKMANELNEMSDHFIKFSLAFNDLKLRINQLAEDHPTLFQH